MRRTRFGRVRVLPALLVPLFIALPTPPGLSAQVELQHRMLRDKLTHELETRIHGFEGVAGVQVIDLATGETVGVNADLVFPQGSAIKITLLLELFRRAEAEPGLLARRIEMTDGHRTGGSGILQNLTDGGTALSLEDLAVLMIVHSDNTATNILLDEMGMDAVNALHRDLGAPATLFRRKMIRPDASARGEENVSTPAEAARIMERIARCQLPMSEAACFRVQDILEIPKSGDFRAPIPTSVPVAWKPGGVEGVSTAWGLVALPDRPYAVAVMTTYGSNGGALVRSVSEVVYDHFARLARSTEYGVRVPLEVIRRVRGGGGTP
jgi:beta-lactamase class A